MAGVTALMTGLNIGEVTVTGRNGTVRRQMI
jgi:hypothetical protein